MAKQYSEETKAAVMAALLTGQSVSQIARDYNLPPGTVSSWKHRRGALQDVAESTRNDASQKSEIGELVLTYLKANLQSLAEQTRVFSDPQWLNKQPASELAVLHGVMTDKAIRLIEALTANEVES